MKAQELKEHRLKLGFTMQKMAYELNTPVKTYHNWEYGTRRIPGIVKIALKAILL